MWQDVEGYVRYSPNQVEYLTKDCGLSITKPTTQLVVGLNIVTRDKMKNVCWVIKDLNTFAHQVGWWEFGQASIGLACSIFQP